MSLITAFILGLVEGLTEYLPVSSTGHLLVAQRFLKIPEGEAANAFAVFVQAGAILAVLNIYFGRIKQIILGFFGKDKDGLRLGINLVIAFMPAAALGLLLGDMIENYLFGLIPVIIAWTVGGILILIFTKRPILQKRQKKELKDLSVKESFVIGCCQCLAMWPGTSRSLASIAGGLIVRLKKEAAIEFSFLLGGLTLFAATVLTVIKHHEALTAEYDKSILVVGFVVAWASAFVSVKWMVGFLKKHSFAVFGWWRLLAAALTLLLLAK